MQSLKTGAFRCLFNSYHFVALKKPKPKPKKTPHKKIKISNLNIYIFKVLERRCKNATIKKKSKQMKTQQINPKPETAIKTT